MGWHGPSVTPGQQLSPTPGNLSAVFLLLFYLVGKEISPEVWLISILASTRQFILSLCTHLILFFSYALS